MKLIGKTPRVTRRAVFVFEHHEHGTVVINRSLFVRKVRANLDECLQGSSKRLIDKAEEALRRVWGKNFEPMLERHQPFRLPNGKKDILECTVFFMNPCFPLDETVLGNLTPDTFLPVHLHEHGADIKSALEASKTPHRKSA